MDFLDVSFDLATDSYKPYKKPNDNPMYIHTHSNHPPHIIKQLPTIVGSRLSKISSCKKAFNEAAPEYNAALKNSGYKDELRFTTPPYHTLTPPNQIQTSRISHTSTPTHNNTPLCSHAHPSSPPTPNTNNNKKTKKNRNRNKHVLWYNPPFNAAVTTNIGKRFLELIDTHFPKTRPDKLHKIFNRHLIKLSYSCTPNMKSIITSHNAKILANAKNTPKHDTLEKTCNCRKTTECPLQGNCQQQTVVYKATIKTPTCTKTYIGSTENSFKQRFYGHKTDMNKPQNRHNTTLAHYIWECKDKGISPIVNWEVIRQCKKYKCGSRKCDLCLTEKVMILKDKGSNLLNRRSELMSRCPHQRKWRLQSLKSP